MIKKFLRFLLFVFESLFLKGRWFLWVLVILLLLIMGSTITALRMEIPDVQKVNRISGKFIDTGKGYSKGVLFDIGIVDALGDVHKCNCEPLAYSNCLGRKPADYTGLLKQLNAETLKNHAPQKAIVQWLAGRDGEVWMYPNRSLFGTPNSCYQISSNGMILWSFEQSVDEYKNAKSSIDVYLLWLIALSGIVALLILVVVRIAAFLKGAKSGQPRS